MPFIALYKPIKVLLLNNGIVGESLLQFLIYTNYKVQYENNKMLCEYAYVMLI